MSDFESKSRSLFQRFTTSLSNVDLRFAAAVPAMTGALLAFYGCALEAHGQTQLLVEGGRAALEAYDHLVQSNVLQLGLNPDSLSDLVQHGLKGDLASFGGNTQLRGVALMGMGPALSTAAVLLSRGFLTLKETLRDALKALQPDQALSDKRADAPSAR